MTRFQLFTFKRYLEQIIMSPFVLLGHLLGLFFPKSNYDIFFFIPIYGVGGAEYVNAKILEVLRTNKRILVVFTKRSSENTALHLFTHTNVTLYDISKYIDSKFLFLVNLTFRGIMASKILRQNQTPTIFIGQCNFAYKLTPHLYRKCKVIELTHGYDKRFTYVWMPFIPFLTQRLGISYRVIEEMKEFQRSIGVPEAYIKFDKLTLFTSTFKDIHKIKKKDNELKIFFAGRNSPEKRLHLIYEIARQIKIKKFAVRFSFVGALEESIEAKYRNIGDFVGLVSAGYNMSKFISTQDAVILTSTREGLPIVVLESMSLGLIPIVTPVGDLPFYINQSNGYVLNGDSDNAIIGQALSAIDELTTNGDIYTLKSKGAKKTFEESFTESNFYATIEKLFN